MPQTVYDQDGNAIELPLTVEEIGQTVKKTQELETQNKEIAEKLKVYENKEFNWKQLRDMNDEERAKLTAAELKLKEEQEKHSQEIFGIKESLLNNWKEKALYQLIGEDADLKVKINEEYEKIKTDANSEVEIMTKMAKAFTYVTGQRPGIDPIKASFGTMSGESPRINSADAKKASPAVKEFGKNFGITEDDWKKVE